jgi:hypothetical protein
VLKVSTMKEVSGTFGPRASVVVPQTTITSPVRKEALYFGCGGCGSLGVTIKSAAMGWPVASW